MTNLQHFSKDKDLGLCYQINPFLLWVGCEYETSYRVDQLVYIPGICRGISESLAP